MTSSSNQNLLRKFEKRIDSVKNADFDSLQQSLLNFWAFFNNEPTLRQIRENLVNQFPNISDKVTQIFYSRGSIKIKELSGLESIAIACEVLYSITQVESDRIRGILQASVYPTEFSIIEYRTQSAIDEKSSKIFKDWYLDKFSYYVEEQLENAESTSKQQDITQDKAQIVESIRASVINNSDNDSSDDLTNLILTLPQRLWLKTVYAKIKNGEAVNIRAIKIELKDKLPSDFNPSEIRGAFLRKDKITILGIALIEPESEIVQNTNTILNTVRKILEKNPEIERISAQEISNLSGLPEKDVAYIFEDLAFLGMFHQTGTSYGIRGWASINITDRGFDEYLQFKSIQQIIDSLIEQKQQSKVALQNSMQIETPEQRRFRLLKIIYDLAEGNPFTEISYGDIHQESQMETDSMIGILQYLEQRDLIKMHLHKLQITAFGIDEIERTKNHPENPTSYFPANIYNTFNAPVTGVLQGQNNIQHNTQNLNANFTIAIEKLLALVENSSLTPLEKIKTKSNIQTIRDLAETEKSPEIIEEANSRIEAVKDVISMTADMTSLGMVLIQILQAAFVR
jgi:hypothetical protein